MSNLWRLSAAVASMTLIFSACGSEQASEPLAAPSLEESAASPPAEPAATPSSTTEGSSEESGGDAQKVQAKIIDTDFRPVEVTIAPGATIRWKQVGDQPHSVSAVDGSFESSPDCGPIDSDKCLGEGDTFTAKFDEAGTFDYYCRVHGLPDGTGMFGTIVVK